MASDITNIIKDELSNTLEQLLSKKTSVENVSTEDLSSFDSSQFIRINIGFEFKTLSSIWQFLIPTVSATKFEYFMLGGMGALKEHIDDEIADAVNEIISNICGSIVTSVNAQGFDDLSGAKFDIKSNEIIDTSKIGEPRDLYNFELSLDDEKLPVLIKFDEAILPFISQITGKEITQKEEAQVAGGAPMSPSNQGNTGPTGTNDISGLLGDDAIDNLKLLFDIKLKLSVRLGTKLFLLKDILRWDIGEIIELDQMVNEPLDILINGVKVGEGEAVIVEGKFGLKIRNIGNERTKLKKIGIG